MTTMGQIEIFSPVSGILRERPPQETIAINLVRAIVACSIHLKGSSRETIY